MDSKNATMLLEYETRKEQDPTFALTLAEFAVLWRAKEKPQVCELQADLKAANQYVAKCNNLILSQDAQLAESARQITRLLAELKAAQKENAILNQMVELAVTSAFRDSIVLANIDTPEAKKQFWIEYYRAKAEKEQEKNKKSDKQ